MKKRELEGRKEKIPHCTVCMRENSLEREREREKGRKKETETDRQRKRKIRKVRH